MKVGISISGVSAGGPAAGGACGARGWGRLIGCAAGGWGTGADGRPRVVGKFRMPAGPDGRPMGAAAG
jgi:hypothetical protein